MKKLLLIGAILITAVLFLRFVVGGDEDTWICEQTPASTAGSGGARWIKHGHPDYPAPVVPCGAQNPLPNNETDCLAGGGVWGQLGPNPRPTCNRKAIDRGNLCRDNGECEGMCQVDLTQDELSAGMRGKINKNVKYGQCSVWVIELGCRGMMEKGKAQVICVD